MDKLITQNFVIAADHGGFVLKQHLLGFFESQQIRNVKDLGQFDDKRSDFPHFSKLVADAILNRQVQWGILVCGSGIGVSIAANRFKGIRCALCHDVTTATLARQHNNANVLALGGRLIGTALAEDIVRAFAETAFLGSHYKERMDMTDTIC